MDSLDKFSKADARAIRDVIRRTARPEDSYLLWLELYRAVVDNHLGPRTRADLSAMPPTELIPALRRVDKLFKSGRIAGLVRQFRNETVDG